MGMYTLACTHKHAYTHTVAWVFIYVCAHTYTYSYTNTSTCAHDVPMWCDIREYTSRCRHTYVCMPVHKHAHLPCLCVHTCAQWMCTGLHMHKWPRSHRHKNVHACVHTPALVYIHPHTRIRAHARMHVHTALVLLSRLQWPGLGRTPIS